jgi:preprotein translocase subunit SecG
MTLLHNIVLLVQILSALGMIGLVLVQHGKGADMGAAFGSGSSGSLFGASGGANFLSRTTAVLATVFFIATLTLAYLGNVRPDAGNAGSVLERSTPSSVPAPVGADPSVPAPAPAADSKPEQPQAPAGNIPR